MSGRVPWGAGLSRREREMGPAPHGWPVPVAPALCGVRTDRSPPLIRVAVIDDHDAVRLGLRTALLATPDLEPVGSAATAAEAQPLLYRVRPDVVLGDYRLPDIDGLTLCRRIKSEPPAPGVVLFSAFADATMTVPAVVAGMLVHRTAPAEIAATLTIERLERDRRIADLLARLKIPVPAR